MEYDNEHCNRVNKEVEDKLKRNKKYTYDEAFTEQKQRIKEQAEEVMGMSKKKSEEYSYTRDFVVVDMQKFRTENKVVYI